jgi:hypothetical protein
MLLKEQNALDKNVEKQLHFVAWQLCHLGILSFVILSLGILSLGILSLGILSLGILSLGILPLSDW